ncbi:MAG: Crp/Fnr family transcriptional regulator [Saprospiraceae bacterium]
MALHALLLENLNRTVTITEAETEKMLQLARVTKLKKKEHLFMEGQVAKYVGFVNKGCLRYYRLDENGEEHIVYFAIEEWWIGDLSSFYIGLPSSFNLQAIEPCEMFLYTKENFERVRLEIPAFDEYCKIRHAKATDARLETMMSQRSDSAESRYTKLLDGFPDIFQRVPQHFIASYLGIKPQSLSRIRKQMAERAMRER